MSVLGEIEGRVGAGQGCIQVAPQRVDWKLRQLGAGRAATPPQVTWRSCSTLTSAAARQYLSPSGTTAGEDAMTGLLWCCQALHVSRSPPALEVRARRAAAVRAGEPNGPAGGFQRRSPALRFHIARETLELKGRLETALDSSAWLASLSDTAVFHPHWLTSKIVEIASGVDSFLDACSAPLTPVC